MLWGQPVRLCWILQRHGTRYCQYHNQEWQQPVIEFLIKPLWSWADVYIFQENFLSICGPEKIQNRNQTLKIHKNANRMWGIIASKASFHLALLQNIFMVFLSTLLSILMINVLIWRRLSVWLSPLSVLQTGKVTLRFGQKRIFGSKSVSHFWSARWQKQGGVGSPM